MGLPAVGTSENFLDIELWNLLNRDETLSHIFSLVSLESFAEHLLLPFIPNISKVMSKKTALIAVNPPTGSVEFPKPIYQRKLNKFFLIFRTFD